MIARIDKKRCNSYFWKDSEVSIQRCYTHYSPNAIGILIVHMIQSDTETLPKAFTCIWRRPSSCMVAAQFAFS